MSITRSGQETNWILVSGNWNLQIDLLICIYIYIYIGSFFGSFFGFAGFAVNVVWELMRRILLVVYKLKWGTNAPNPNSSPGAASGVVYLSTTRWIWFSL